MSTSENKSVPPVTAAQVEKARMLVSMLGADFAKGSSHPFFKDLARTAVKPVDKPPVSSDMSEALARLVKTLADPQVVARLNPKSAAPSMTVDPDLVHQHPVIIAKNLLPQTKPERLAIMDALPGMVRLQVTSYLNELEATVLD